MHIICTRCSEGQNHNFDNDNSRTVVQIYGHPCGTGTKSKSEMSRTFPGQLATMYKIPWNASFIRLTISQFCLYQSNVESTSVPSVHTSIVCSIVLATM